MKYLDYEGLSYLWNKIKSYITSKHFAGSAIDGGPANKAVSIPFGQVDSTSTATAFTATVDGITELRDGVCVYLYNGVVTSTTNCTLNINGLGAKPIYYSTAETTRLSTAFSKTYTCLFIYRETKVSGGCWEFYYGYNSDNIYNQMYYQRGLPMADYTNRYRLLFTSADNNKWVPASTSTSTNTTDVRDVNQRPINPFGPIVYYASSTAKAEGEYLGDNTAYIQYYSVSLGYSFNRTGTALVLTARKPLYIKCNPQTDGSVIIDSVEPYVQELPSSEDGKVYIFLGITSSTTTFELSSVHPVYYYKNGAIRSWTNECDPTVPAWAKAATKPSYTADEVGAMVDYSKQYLTCVALEDGTISFNIWYSMGTEYITSISYSTDNGSTWTTTNNTNNKANYLQITVNVSTGDKVLWKGNAQQLGYYDEDDEGDYVGSFFSSDCEFDVQGNVMSLVYGDNFISETTLEEDGIFACLFSDYYHGEYSCSVVDASNLVLPSTTLAKGCYAYMFSNCTSLTSAPELPATTLADHCYQYMFYGCSSLTSAPELPATTMASGCYYGMFYNCTSLSSAPQLPATTLVISCYYDMFNGCTALNSITCLATDISAYICTTNWVSGVAASGTFIKADSMSSWTTGSSDIPTGWTVYTKSEYELVHRYELDAKSPLVVEVAQDADFPTGTYASITAAIAEGREVIVKELIEEHSYFNYYMAEEQVSDPNDNMSYVFICPVEGHRQNVIYISQNSTYRAYVNLAFEGHTHGYLKLSGALQTTDVTIANGDKLVITDSSNLNIIARASVTFDGSTTTKALSQKGTWETYASLTSPAFTGTPTAPTAVTKTSTTQLATTAFVLLEIDRSLRIIPLLDNGSTTAGTWLATTNEITSLVDGLIFLYRVAVAGGSSTTTLNITANNVELGAVTIYTNGTNKLTTHYKVGVYLILAYNSTDTCFRVVNFYDSNSTIVYGYYDLYFRPHVAETLYRYKLVALGADNRLHPIVVTNQTNTTRVAKTPTSAGLRPYKIWYYNSTTTVNPKTAVTALVLITTFQSTSATYTFNTSLAAYNLIYLRGTYDSLTDLFYLYIDDSSPCTSYYTLVPTNTANISLANYLTAGYYYWLVGGTYSTTDYYLLFDENPLYYFNGTNLIPASVALNRKWYGTEDEFDALTNLDDNTDYYIYDE